jgi:hypothetical protein
MRPTLPPALRKGPLLFGLGALLWLLAIGLLVWPALRATREQAATIAALDARAATLAGWSGGRALPAADAARWEAALGERFEQLFPRERHLEQLFMEIASIANESGVDPVQLRADVGAAYGEGQGELLSARGAGGEPEALRALADQLGLAPQSLPASDLRAYRLLVEFDADYANLARFTDALPTLSRAVCVRSLRAGEGLRGVAVQMELEYYVQARN